MTIIEFLTARYDEDEAKAAICTAAWPTEAEKVYDEVYSLALPVMDADDPGDWDVRVRAEEARHIVRYSPAAVLADLASKRAIVALHGPHAELCYWTNDGWRTHDGEVCDTLCLLAAPFAFHPDYDPAWAVAR